MKWIDVFLCYRQQRVVVNGVKSDWAPVVSGVPQGTVLGPSLFSLQINDITAGIVSEIRFFADDCVCYREVKDIEDTLKFHFIGYQNFINDLTKLVSSQNLAHVQLRVCLKY